MGASFAFETSFCSFKKVQIKIPHTLKSEILEPANTKNEPYNNLGKLISREVKQNSRMMEVNNYYVATLAASGIVCFTKK